MSFLLLSVMGLAHAALLAALPIYPFVDLPLHLAAATILRDSRAPAGILSNFYALDMSLKPNLAHMLFCALPVFPSVEAANKAYFCLYALSVPLLVWLILRRLGGETWLALLSFLLLYNFNVAWGFVEYVLSIPALLLFTLLLSARRLPDTPAGKVCIAVVLFSFFYIHIIMAVFAGVFYAVWSALRRPRSIGGFGLRLLPALPLVALTIVWLSRQPVKFGQENTLEYLLNYYVRNYLPEYAMRRILFYLDNFYLLMGWEGFAVGVGAVSVILFCATLALMGARGRLRRIFLSRRAAAVCLLTLCSLAFFLATPPWMPGHAYIFQRFSVYFWLGFILVAGLGRPRRFAPAVAALATIAAVAHFAIWTACFVEFTRETRTFRTAIIPSIPRGCRVGYALFDFRFHGEVKGAMAFAHFPDYHIIRNHSPATTFLTETRFGPVRRRDDVDYLPPYLKVENLAEELRLRPESIFEGVEYLLVRGRTPRGLEGYFKNFVRVKGDEKWSLMLRRDFLRPPNAAPAATQSASASAPG